MCSCNYPAQTYCFPISQVTDVSIIPQDWYTNICLLFFFSLVAHVLTSRATAHSNHAQNSFLSAKFPDLGMKMGLDHKWNWYECVKLNRGYYHIVFWKSHFNSSWKKKKKREKKQGLRSGRQKSHQLSLLDVHSNYVFSFWSVKNTYTLKNTYTNTANMKYWISQTFFYDPEYITKVTIMLNLTDLTYKIKKKHG